MSVSHFDEKSGIVPFKTEWGQWWQTVDEVHIELTNLDHVKSRDVLMHITPNGIKCTIRGNVVLQVLKRNIFEFPFLIMCSPRQQKQPNFKI